MSATRMISARAGAAASRSGRIAAPDPARADPAARAKRNCVVPPSQIGKFDDVHGMDGHRSILVQVASTPSTSDGTHQRDYRRDELAR